MAVEKKVNIAVFVSGGGTNLQALIDAQKKGVLQSGEIKLVIASNPNAYAIRRAEKANIPVYSVSRSVFGTVEEVEAEICNILDSHGIDLIILAGYLSILSSNFTKKYDHRILNIHPSLIPAFCGEGYYGLRVHEEVLKRGVKITGATVHFVNEIPDGGEIIMQKPVTVRPDDTPESLQKRVMKIAEWQILPCATEQVASEMLKKKDGEQV